uniref:Uncharacterized protein n=1 Tax=Plectus sambesii TaxID=2011161 RepID=A0A914UQQ1_9BILA
MATDGSTVDCLQGNPLVYAVKCINGTFGVVKKGTSRLRCTTCGEASRCAHLATLKGQAVEHIFADDLAFENADKNAKTVSVVSQRPIPCPPRRLVNISDIGAVLVEAADGLMFLYLSSFVISAQPLVAMWQMLKMMQTFAGISAGSKTFRLMLFKDAWMAFTNLLKVYVDKLMLCNEPGCGQYPMTIILDGHALGLRQQLLDQAVKDQMAAHRPDAPVLEGGRAFDPWLAKHRSSLELLLETLPIFTAALGEVRRWEGALPQEVRLLIIDMLRIYDATFEMAPRPSDSNSIRPNGAPEKTAYFPQWLVIKRLELYKSDGSEKELEAADLCNKAPQGAPDPFAGNRCLLVPSRRVLRVQHNGSTGVSKNAFRCVHHSLASPPPPAPNRL